MKDINTIKSKSIVEFLKKEGFLPFKENNRDVWYLSPFRAERTASFKVSKKLNRWYDHGIGDGGTIIDLMMKMKNINFKEAINSISDNNLPILNSENYFYEQPNLFIKKVEALNHPALIQYLNSRGISISLANQYLKEVYYVNNNKIYFALGLKNNSGGWELRNKYSKISTSPKSTTHLINNKKKLIVVEGMFDFLSLLSLKPKLEFKTDFLVLNSLSFIDMGITIAKEYQTVELYLDNDTAGLNAVKLFEEKVKSAFDMSAMYSEYKDPNEYLKNKIPLS